MKNFDQNLKYKDDKNNKKIIYSIIIHGQGHGRKAN